MSAATTAATACPSWCVHEHSAGNVANEACLSADIEVTDSTGRSFRFGLGTDSILGVLIDINGSEFTPEGARVVIRTLEGLIETAEAPD